MKAATKVTTAEEILEACLANPPEGWRDPDGDGRAAPSRDAIAWRIFLRGGGASAMAGEIPALVVQLNQTRENLEIATARMMKREAAEFRHLIADLEVRIAKRATIVEAAGASVRRDERGKTIVNGGWVDCDQRALMRAAGQAEFNLTEATGRVAPYRVQWPPIKDFEKRFAPELREEAKAEAALKAALKAAAESLAVLDADREALAKLRRRVA